MKSLKTAVAMLLLLSLLGSLLISCAETQNPNDAIQTNTPDSEAEDFPHQNKDHITVCIDPGHGFGDVGCGPALLDTYEYEITLSVAKLLQKKLEDKGVTVILTHDGKSFPSASDITAKADKYNLEYKPENMVDNNVFSAYERVIWENVLDQQIKGGLDLFVSLHVNSIENAAHVSGMSIDYCEDNPNKEFLSAFSKLLEKTYLDAQLTSKFTIFEDTYEDSFIVTKYTQVPSVLIEMGYSTNKKDAADLCSQSWQNQFAALLAEKICFALGK